MADRYFIDERVGCIAVRDRKNTDPEYQGLHHDTPGVVEFWGARYMQSECPTCGHVRDVLSVSPAHEAEAILLCAELNAKDRE